MFAPLISIQFDYNVCTPATGIQNEFQFVSKACNRNLNLHCSVNLIACSLYCIVGLNPWQRNDTEVINHAEKETPSAFLHF